jgi:hypothetical protein
MVSMDLARRKWGGKKRKKFFAVDVVKGGGGKGVVLSRKHKAKLSSYIRLKQSKNTR